jgi:hypothetical protein
LEFVESNIEHAKASFTVSNSGNSPALRTEVSFGVSQKGMVGRNDISPVQGVLVGTVRQNTAIPRPANASIPNPIFEGTALPGNAQIFIRAFVSFEDVFGEEQLDEFDFGAVVPLDDVPQIIPLTDWSSPEIPRLLTCDFEERMRRKRERKMKS